MELKVIHETRYSYQSPVALSQQLLHLKPRELEWQSLASFRLDVEPQATDLIEWQDYFGNPVASFVIASAHTQLSVRSESVVRVSARTQALAGHATIAWETLRDNLRGFADQSLQDAAQFLFESTHIECLRELAGYAAPAFPPGRGVLDCALELAHCIHTDFRFDPSATSVSTPLRQVLADRRGVCQDFAHLMIGCLRTLGLPARYVSGYILTRPPAGTPRLIGADASHAWVSVYCPPLGWVDVDPTNDCLVNDEHVTLAWGRDFSDVPPLRGVILGGEDQELNVAVTVLPLAQRVADGPPFAAR